MIHGKKSVMLHYAIIQSEMGLFLSFSVLELQRGYIYQLYQNGLTEDETVVTLEGSDPKELIKKFFDPVGDIFAGIEMILQV